MSTNERPAWFSELDRGIAPVVALLHDAGIVTIESCEGSPGHCFPEPTVRFKGSRAEAWRALAILLDHALPVLHLRMQWTITPAGDPEGPYWELVLRPDDGTTAGDGRAEVEAVRAEMMKRAGFAERREAVAADIERHVVRKRARLADTGRVGT